MILKICLLHKKAYSGFVIHEFWNKRKREKKKMGPAIWSSQSPFDLTLPSRFYDNSAPAGLKFAFALLTYFFQSARIAESIFLPEDLFGNSSPTLEFWRSSVLLMIWYTSFINWRFFCSSEGFPFLSWLPGTKSHA